VQPTLRIARRCAVMLLLRTLLLPRELAGTDGRTDEQTDTVPF